MRSSSSHGGSARTRWCRPAEETPWLARGSPAAGGGPCAGSAEVDEQAIALATFGGRVVFVGSSPEAFRARAVELCWKELTLLGSRGFTAGDIAEVIDLYLAGDLLTDHLTRGTRPLEEANEALEDLRNGRVLRSVLVPQTRTESTPR